MKKKGRRCSEYRMEERRRGEGSGKVFGDIGRGDGEG